MKKPDNPDTPKLISIYRENGDIELIEHPNVKWYQIENNARILSQDFYKHVLALRVIYNIEGNEHIAFFSGTPLLYKGMHLWLTAGHVIKKIQDMLGNASVRVRNMSWFDHHENEDAGAIPVGDFNELSTCFTNNKNIGDIGIVKPTQLTIQNLKANKNLQWLTEDMWKNVEKVEPDGYYLVGIPHEMTTFQVEQVGTRCEGKAGVYFLCIPIERIESSVGCEPKEFWDYRDFIFAKVIPVHKQNGEQLQSIEGMSGGLVFSVEIESITKSGASGIRYRVFGIQSSWLPESKVIRATPIGNVVDYLKQNIDKLS